MIRFPHAFAVLLCFPMATPILAQTSPDREHMIEVFEAAGCVANRSTGDAIFAVVGLSSDAAVAISRQLVAEGVMVLEQGGTRLTINGCANGPIPPARTGVVAATLWMSNIDDARAGDALAEMIAARGCSVRDDASEAFTDEVARAVAGRFEVDLPTPLPSEDDVQFGGFVQVLDDMGDRGGSHLFSTGGVDVAGGNATLVGCTP